MQPAQSIEENRKFILSKTVTTIFFFKLCCTDYRKGDISVFSFLIKEKTYNKFLYRYKNLLSWSGVFSHKCQMFSKKNYSPFCKKNADGRPCLMVQCRETDLQCAWTFRILNWISKGAGSVKTILTVWNWKVEMFGCSDVPIYIFF